MQYGIAHRKIRKLLCGLAFFLVFLSAINVCADHPTPPGLDLASTERCVAWHVIGVSHIQQRKDTQMVCLDGCPMNGRTRWDREHPSGLLSGGHNDWYCLRACLSMMAAAAGRQLSQDRITYYIFEEAGSASLGAAHTGEIGTPFGDLGHGLGTDAEDLLLAFNWLYNGTGAHRQEFRPSLFDDGDASSVDTVKEYLDDNRPLICDVRRTRVVHSMVVDGYAVIEFSSSGTLHRENYIHVIDPWEPSGSPDAVRWVVFATGNCDFMNFPPFSGRPVREDEPSIGRDSDGDGLCDFDETQRFNTDPNNPDTDGDGLGDKVDMLGYLFNPDGTYNLRNPDQDGDHKYKERDPDNDQSGDTGVSDGCEDYNRDGFFNSDGRETDNFDGTDDGSVFNPYCNDGYLRIKTSVTLAAFPDAPLTTHEEITIDPSAQIASQQYIHDHTWELQQMPMTVNVAGQSITTVGSGSGTGRGKIRLTINSNGHYRLVTDIDPKVGNYQITTTGAGMNRVSTQDLYLAFADHHYGYVSPDTPAFMQALLEAWGNPNVFEGEVQRLSDGRRVIQGSDTIVLPESLQGIKGFANRTWEIILNRIPQR